MHIVHALDFGGVESVMCTIGRVRHASRFERRFVALSGGGAAAEELRVLGAEVAVLDTAGTIPSWSTLGELKRYIRATKPTVVHTHGAEANFHGLICAWINKVPVRVGEEIGVPNHSARARFVFRQIYRLAQKVVGVSDAVSNYLVESKEAPRSKVFTVNNPVREISSFHGVRPSRDKLRIVFLGRIEPIKNPSGLLEAFILLREKGVRAGLRFVGEGSQRRMLEARIGRTPFKHDVLFVGYDSCPEIHLGESHLFVLPSLTEGLSVALLEAMMCGLPAVVTDVGANASLITHGHTGWIVKAPDPASVADGLFAASLAGFDVLCDMGARARASVLGRYSATKYLHDIEQMYSQVLTRSATVADRDIYVR